MYRRFRYRLKPSRYKRDLCLLTLTIFLFIQYLSIKLFNWKEIPSPILSRLHSDKSLVFDLKSYSVCHPKQLDVENLTNYYHSQYANKEICFLIEHLDGGPWWSYVSHEFAEILTDLKRLGLESNINYRSLNLTSTGNLTRFLLNSCEFNEQNYFLNPSPIILLLWDIDRLSWHELSSEWTFLLKSLSLHVLVFIDDLHYTNKKTFQTRQYLFEYITSEIFSTYAYLFDNYYSNISSNKITWLPHASSSLFSSAKINQTARNLLFVSGARVFEWYPCRARAFILCHDRSDLATCLQHPGYGEAMKNDSQFYYGGQRYYSYMRQYTFGLATCQSVHYAIAKLFELPANGLLLVTTDDLVDVLEKLHLNLNEHFLTVKCSSVNQLANGISNLQELSQEKLNKIRIKSQEIIHQRHMTKHRAQLLHVRLLARALIAVSTSDNERTIKWKSWGRICD